jgi:hypothetical protein
MRMRRVCASTQAASTSGAGLASVGAAVLGKPVAVIARCSARCASCRLLRSACSGEAPSATGLLSSTLI